MVDRSEYDGESDQPTDVRQVRSGHREQLQRLVHPERAYHRNSTDRILRIDFAVRYLVLSKAIRDALQVPGTSTVSALDGEWTGYAKFGNPI